MVWNERKGLTLGPETINHVRRGRSAGLASERTSSDEVPLCYYMWSPPQQRGRLWSTALPTWPMIRSDRLCGFKGLPRTGTTSEMQFFVFERMIVVETSTEALFGEASIHGSPSAGLPRASARGSAWRFLEGRWRVLDRGIEIGRPGLFKEAATLHHRVCEWTRRHFFSRGLFDCAALIKFCVHARWNCTYDQKQECRIFLESMPVYGGVEI